MCGIAAIFAGPGDVSLPDWPFHPLSTKSSLSFNAKLPSPGALLRVLSRRGPDALASLALAVPTPECPETAEITLELTASTLSQRQNCVPQHPRVLRVGDSIGYMLFNGEIYDVETSDTNPDASDAVFLGDILAPLVAERQSRACIDTIAESVLERLDKLRGPFAVVLWAPAVRRLYFVRDVLGRRSLLLAAVPGSGLIITSVAPEQSHLSFSEVPPQGLCYVEVGLDGTFQFGCIGRTNFHVAKSDRACESCHQPCFPREVHKNRALDKLHPESITFLNRPMLRLCRCDDAITHRLNEDGLPNACDEQNTSVTRKFSTTTENDVVCGFLNVFETALRRRLVLKSSSLFANPVLVQSLTSHCVIDYAVLFSGGVDSLFVATFLHKILAKDKPFDLINVAFGESQHRIACCPDRETAVAGLHDVRRSGNGQRDIRLICVDVAPEEADNVLEQRVRHLLNPCSLLMDASIGTALWTAARGRGYTFAEHGRLSTDDRRHRLCSVRTRNERVSSCTATEECEDRSCAKEAAERLPDDARCSQITSPAKILFSGLGADELMGGYKGKHRNSFAAGGVAAVSSAINCDLSRLWYRNLGRDDRIVSDLGRELRHPFLDEDVIGFVANLPLSRHVCDLSQPDGVGDKLLLRKAALRIGLPLSASQRKKKAMQFGSRSKHVLERRR